MPASMWARGWALLTWQALCKTRPLALLVPQLQRMAVCQGAPLMGRQAPFLADSWCHMLSFTLAC